MVRELLPMSPVSAEMLDARMARMNADFGRRKGLLLFAP